MLNISKLLVVHFTLNLSSKLNAKSYKTLSNTLVNDLKNLKLRFFALIVADLNVFQLTLFHAKIGMAYLSQPYQDTQLCQAMFRQKGD